MKKLLFLIALLLLITPVQAKEIGGLDDNLLLNGQISFDWCTKSQLERDKNISEIHDIIYNSEIQTKINKNELKEEYKDFLKDPKCNEHIKAIYDGKKQNETERFAGFYYKNTTLMIAYGVQYKNDIYNTYYYDMFGNLRYIDKYSKNYPNFPYYTHKYYINGELVESAYFTAYDTQYMYEKGKFVGVWFKDTMFNAKAKKTLTRTNY